MHSLGQKPSDEELKEMIADVDIDGNEQIEFEEFCHLMSRNMNTVESIDTVKEAFTLLDKDDSGSISHAELKELMTSFSRLGEDIPDSEIDALIQEADVDGDGQISYEEFAKVMMKDG
jgi:calmodulin